MGAVAETLEQERVEQRSEPRVAVLQAAAECFMEHGFAATSIDDVARRLGATKGMVYHHFRSKTDLFFAVYKRGMDINFETIAPLVDTPAPPVKRLFAMARTHAFTMMAQQPFQRTVSQGVVMHQTGATTRAQRTTLDELIRIRDDYETLFSNAILAACRDAGTEPDDISLTTKSFLAVLNSPVHWYTPRSAKPEAEQQRLAAVSSAFALRGLGLTPPKDS
ncbi:TetR/AcrR family transcriptional regulator [Rhizobiaceae bacterium]|nr:TetR/AcrR family transcriptional regulator [Rhizobiaceae bacterium]